MNKKKNKRFTSIAIKINSKYVRDTFFELLGFNMILIILIGGIWCLSVEKAFYGSLVEEAQRSLSLHPIESANYTVVWNNGKTMIKDASDFLYSLKFGGAVLLIFEGGVLLDRIIFGTGRVRKYLKPLDEMAEAAERLSNMTFDEEKFQDLEKAISNISPTSSDEKISIGDSELQGLEDAINTLLEKMRASYRQQARFVSDASHELRTPISVIQGYANMLDRWGKNDESILEESIVAIKSESESMKILVDQLLFLARGINGKNYIDIKEFSLSDMLSEVFEESRMIDENHSYEYIKSEDIRILGDVALLKQTARILVENAVKYTDEGELILIKVGRNEKETYFCVEDSGIGIDERDVPYIFERFFRADTTRGRKDGGTGLGLSIAKWIVDNHKGYFGVLSRKGIGTRITVFLGNIDKTS